MGSGRKRCVLPMIIGLVLIGFMAIAASAADGLDEIKKRGSLVVGVKDNLPPFGYLDSETGKLAGYEVELASALAEKLGVKLELRPVAHLARISELMNGKVDLVVANLMADPEVGKDVDFSDGYLLTGIGFLLPTGQGAEIEYLKGKRIAVLSGSFAERAVRSNLPDSEVVPFANVQEAADALKGGKVDAGAGDMSLLPALGRGLGDDSLDVADFDIEEVPYVVGMRKGETALKQFVDKSLQELESDGVLEQLFVKWFLDDEQEGESDQAATAAGVIVRRAQTPPRFLAKLMVGMFAEGDEVSIYNTNGEFVCEGTIGRIFGEEIYVVADQEKYQLVLPGFPFGAGVNKEAAKDAILEHQDLLLDIAEKSAAEMQAIRDEINEEAKEKEERLAEQEMMSKKSHNIQKVQRSYHRNNSRYYRSSHYRRRYYRY